MDIEDTVVSTEFKVEGAARGFKPHNRKRPGYHPITNYMAELGSIVRLENRPDNVHDGKASLGFLENLFAQHCLQTALSLQLNVRMDAAFFLDDMLDLLSAEQVQ